MDEKELYCNKVKTIQRSGGAGADAWTRFCDQTGGKRDPSLHSTEMLRMFCLAADRGDEPQVPAHLRRNRSRSRGRGGGDEGNGLVLKMRGLPYSVTVQEIVEFLINYGVQEEDVVLGFKDGRPSGEAFATFSTREVAQEALEERHKQMIGSRWVEVFRVNEAERDAAAGQADAELSGDNQPVLRLRGLPFGSVAADVAAFVQGQVNEEDVIIEMGRDGRMTGDAFVGFPDQELADKIERDFQRQRMGTRYIEFFRSSMGEWMRARDDASRYSRRDDYGGRGRRDGGSGDSVFDSLVHEVKKIQRQGDEERQRWWDFCSSRGQSTFDPLRQTQDFLEDFLAVFKSGEPIAPRADGPGRSRSPRGHESDGRLLKLRGLPFQATVDDVVNFCMGYDVVADDVMIGMKGSRPSGDAFVTFQDAETADRAMNELQRKEIGSRYIELLQSSKREMDRHRGY